MANLSKIHNIWPMFYDDVKFEDKIDDKFHVILIKSANYKSGIHLIDEIRCGTLSMQLSLKFAFSKGMFNRFLVD